MTRYVKIHIKSYQRSGAWRDMPLGVAREMVFILGFKLAF